jgi:ATP-dependent Lon protease
MFITTANTLHTIPQPLMDRMEIIQISGYTELEKLAICRRYLIPKQIENNGLKEDNLEIAPDALIELVRRYTKESGVRNLERVVATVCRKAAMEVVERDDENHKVYVDHPKLLNFLGQPKYRYGKSEESHQVGTSTGLAWTELGGALLVIETTILPGKGRLQITGKLGDVMQESARAAVSYVRSRAEMLGLPRDFYEKIDIHVHVPEGGIPKDGPSAGITMALSIVSAITGIPINKEIAMTGEITLRGNVLPIGGLKEKALAAHRGGSTRVMMPIDNDKDVEEIPATVRADLELIPVAHVDEVLFEGLLCLGPKHFEQLLDQKVFRDEHLFSESMKPGRDLDESVKGTSPVVAH